LARERWVDIAEETAYGTENATPDATLSYVELDAAPDQGRIIEFESSHDMKDISVLGPFLGTGRLSLFARPAAIGYFLNWALGGLASLQQDSGTVYKHTMTQDLDSIKSFTLDDCRELPTDKARRLVSCLIKSLTLEAPARGLLTCEVDFQYQWEKIITKPTVGTFETDRPFVFSGGQVELDDVAVANVEAVRFVMANLVPDDTHELNSRKLPEIAFEGSEWTVEMDLKFKDWAMRQNFYGGTATPTEPQDEEREFKVELLFVGGLTGDATVTNFKCDVTLPKCVIKENPSAVSKRDRLTQRLIMEALYDTGNQVELYNEELTIP